MVDPGDNMGGIRGTENFGYDGYVNYFACSNGYTGVHMSNLINLYILNMSMSNIPP